MLTSVDTEIIASMAQTLHVMAYASAVEEGDIHKIVAKSEGWEVVHHPDMKDEPYYLYGPDETDSHKAFRDEARAWQAADVDVSRPSAGGDWMDYAPPVTQEAETTAAYLGGQIHERNGKSLLFLVRDAAVADGKDPDNIQSDYLRDFGYCMAMEALGSGVRWSDNHPEFEHKTPSIEYYPDWSHLAKKPATDFPAAPTVGGFAAEPAGHEHVR